MLLSILKSIGITIASIIFILFLLYVWIVGSAIIVYFLGWSLNPPFSFIFVMFCIAMLIGAIANGIHEYYEKDRE